MSPNGLKFKEFNKFTAWDSVNYSQGGGVLGCAAMATMEWTAAVDVYSWYSMSYRIKVATGGTVVIDFGDGNSRELVGPADMNHWNTYASLGTYTLKLTGDLEYITWIYFDSATTKPNVIANLETMPPNLTYLNFYQPNSSIGNPGCLSRLASLTYLRLEKCALAAYETRGAWPLSLTGIDFSGSVLDEASVDAVIHDVFINLASRSTSGTLDLGGNSAPSATGAAEAAAIAAHGWTVTTS
jgi:hypothetical protein